MLAGVCGGIGELTGIDANLFRLLWLILIFFGGSGLLIYIILAIVIPQRPEGEVIDAETLQQRREAGRNTTLVIGAVIILIGLALLLNTMGWLPVSLGYLWGLFKMLFWPLLLVGLGLLLIVGAFWGDRGWWRHVRLPESGRVLSRSRDDRMLAGVCGGLGEYFNIDPTLVRLIWVIGTLGTMGTGILAYVLAAIVLPEDKPITPAD